MWFSTGLGDRCCRSFGLDPLVLCMKSSSIVLNLRGRILCLSCMQEVMIPVDMSAVPPH